MTFKKVGGFFRWSARVKCHHLFSHQFIMFLTINPCNMNKFSPKLRIKVKKIQQPSVKVSGSSRLLTFNKRIKRRIVH